MNRDIQDSDQAILNRSYSDDFGILGTLPVGYDGSTDKKAGIKVEVSKQTAKKITVSGSDTYVATAPIGTAQSTAGWQVKKINVTGGDTVITWAETDGVPNANFSHVATDLVSLSYS
jgi:hypothetical protein